MSRNYSHLLLATVMLCSCIKGSLTLRKQEKDAGVADVQAPTVSQSTLTVKALSRSEISIGWTKATDLISTPEQLSYKVVGSLSDNVVIAADFDKVGEDGRFLVSDWTKDIDTAKATGLNKYKKYYFNVLVKDEAGNTEPYAPGSATTPAFWMHDSYLKAANNANGFRFGTNLAVSGDTLVVGAPGEKSTTTAIINGATLAGINTTGNDNGAVYVYRRSGSQWLHEAYLKAPNNSNDDQFGMHVAISGNTIAVGAGSEDSTTSSIIHGSSLGATNNGGSNLGAVYVFKRTGTTWTHEAYLKAPNPSDGDNFGSNLSIDGDTLVIGAPNEGSTTTAIIHGSNLAATNDLGSDRGAVYVYKRTNGTWSHEAYLKASNSSDGSEFGSSVKILGDTIIAGAKGENSTTATIINGTNYAATNNSGSSNGAVYVFRRSGSTWAPEAYLKAPNNHDDINFGVSIDLVDDTAVIGGFYEKSTTKSIVNNAAIAGTNTMGSQIGAAYVFRRAGTQWSHEAYLKAPNAVNDSLFGFSVAIAGDLIAVGAYTEPSNTTSIIHGADLSATNSSSAVNGAAYVFRRTNSTWSHEAYLKPPKNSVVFGSSVATDGDMIIVGGALEQSTTSATIYGADLSATNVSGSENGAVYVFK